MVKETNQDDFNLDLMLERNQKIERSDNESLKKNNVGGSTKVELSNPVLTSSTNSSKENRVNWTFFEEISKLDDHINSKEVSFKTN